MLSLFNNSSSDHLPPAARIKRLGLALTLAGAASFSSIPALAQDAEVPATPVAATSPKSNKISDWALAGVIWSDASLVRKLASEARERTDDPKRAQELDSLIRQTSEVIQSLESFGWKLRSQQAVATRGPAPAEDSTSAEAMPNTTTPNTMPNPEQVGAALKEELRQTRPELATDSKNSPVRNSKRSTAGSSRTGLERFDTQTPAGVDDPGADDEYRAARTPVDVDNYRVDDYVDETGREARNRADAVEDGVEGAIAAASGRLGMGRGLGARISEREIQTLSATLPYSDDSIYDADDYDPDRDYRVDNPLAADLEAETGRDRGDLDDDISRDADPKEIDGEDEMIADMANSPRARVAPQPQRRSSLQRFTTEEVVQQRDAQWVQFQLDTNELVLRRYTTTENLQQRTNDAVTKLKTDASVAWDTTKNEQLKAVLETISKF
ncbi:hypothetical protein LOC71_12640 [Rhodopirellula sp. JC740]|uniref:Uncharacterized protein n=1 Tax=Rhodopirellula halodulae TaxID=2894198 RepID=A0ABS8NHU6_9BACT|nr:hypothetical protein [Rhodopirellula sp. JC740]MCC9643126.1 hypothetical protein [Rhodopirellula sp. JC740]